MRGMPFWLKWVALPIAGVVIAFWAIAAVVGFVLHTLIYLAIGVAAIGVLYWGYDKVMMEVPAYRRKKLRDRERKNLY